MVQMYSTYHRPQVSSIYVEISISLTYVNATIETLICLI